LKKYIKSTPIKGVSSTS